MKECFGEQPPLGFVGLGVMGLPMALNLSRAGYSLIVYDIDPNAVARAVEAIPKVEVAHSPPRSPKLRRSW